MIKKFYVLITLLFLVTPVFGQLSQQQQLNDGSRQHWWLTLEQGKLRFRAGDYGRALLQFEDARRQRRAAFEQMERDLIHLLSQREVRRLQDNLERIEMFSQDNHYTAANAAFRELFYRVPRTTFNNSATRALEALGRLKDYPEAEYWIGEVYRVEGELPLALTQYRRVYEMRSNLEDPGFAVTVQYRIGSVLFTMQDYNGMERTYLSVINEYDNLWINARNAETSRAENTVSRPGTPSIPYAQASASFTTTAMNRTLRTEGVGKLLELYRYNNAAVENAHRQLGFYYIATTRQALDHLMYSFVIQNTIIIEEIRRRQFDFTLTDPNPPRRPQPSARELLLIGEEIRKSPALVSYAEEVEYYKTAYYLALSLFRNNYTPIARTVWEFLAAHPEAGEWHSRAVQQLRSPRDEPAVIERR